MLRPKPLAALLLALLLQGCAVWQDEGSASTGWQSPLLPGNQITLLLGEPQTTQAMEAAIAAAQSSIHLETYLFDQDPVGLRFAELLMQRQRAGVKTRIIYDAVGVLDTPDAFFEPLRAAGIELLAYNPINPFKLQGRWLPNRRDHRKILVVDGKIAFTGGVNITQSYATGSPFHSSPGTEAIKGWRDTHVRIEGPAVAALQSVFLRTWNAHASHPVPLAGLFPPLDAAGDKAVQLIASEPNGQMEIYWAYMRAIRAARRSIHLTCAYFVPDAAMLQALVEAARRGVDVKIILPSVHDGSLVFYASHAFFERLLEGGVHLYQIRGIVLHAKTAVIDGQWSTVGSTNLDTRSFLHNSEINAVVIDQAFGQAMEATFASDLEGSQELQLEQWRQRPLSERLKEWAAMQWDYWL